MKDSAVVSIGVGRHSVGATTAPRLLLRLLTPEITNAVGSSSGGAVQDTQGSKAPAVRAALPPRADRRAHQAVRMADVMKPSRGGAR